MDTTPTTPTTPDEPEFIDPFEEEWDDEEMGTKQAEYQRLLKDAGQDLSDELDRVAAMSPEEQDYISGAADVVDQTTGVEMGDVEGSLTGMDPTPVPDDSDPVQTDISTNELGSMPAEETGS